MNHSRTSASSPSPCPPGTAYTPSGTAGRGARARVRSAVTAGLLVAVAFPALSLTGTAYAEEPAAKASSPSAAPAEPGTPGPAKPGTPAPAEPGTSGPKPAPARPNAERSAAPSAERSAAPSAERSAAPVRGSDGDATRTPGDSAAKPAPAPAPARDELAKTGASTTTNVAMGVGAALLIAGGGGAMYAARRRNSAG
ncbi:LPXTG cell wall anchor domain-containing protein [Streptomyces sp. CB02923]|uniref:LPXTG cell wall anchor domain-containing protein n=1 Tax=Streptomyces sp. CB02923 TaxID=1718985 RepID=UPI0018FFF004|nr:LPXTG cell wall anchor domain-containing protein [Streptomyces sp. CB02923]